MSKTTTRARAGFSLIELMVALTITAVIGAAMTLLFVSQARFLEIQQKQEFARGVSRSATNIINSELRMIDPDSGVSSASNSSIILRVPYAMGIECAATASLVTFSMLPVDTFIFNRAVLAGWAYRQSDKHYKYVTAVANDSAKAGTAATCTASPVNITTLTSEGGAVKQVKAASLPVIPVGAAFILYHTVRYRFTTSTSVPSKNGLFRIADGVTEEIVAPFDTSAKFKFYINDAATAVNSAPTNLATLTGIELVLNTVNEKPNSDGSYTVVPFRTSVFFKNRR